MWSQFYQTLNLVEQQPCLCSDLMGYNYVLMNLWNSTKEEDLILHRKRAVLYLKCALNLLLWRPLAYTRCFELRKYSKWGGRECVIRLLLLLLGGKHWVLGIGKQQKTRGRGSRENLAVRHSSISHVVTYSPFPTRKSYGNLRSNISKGV